MNEMKFDLKTMITILTAAAVLGGFYYTTQHRLDHLEDKIEELESQSKSLKAEIIKVRKLATKKGKR